MQTSHTVLNILGFKHLGVPTSTHSESYKKEYKSDACEPLCSTQKEVDVGKDKLFNVGVLQK